MWVQMTESISGGRPNGHPWPPGGYLLECDDWEGEQLIRSQLARRHDAPPGWAAKAAPEQAPAKAVVSEPAATANGPAEPVPAKAAAQEDAEPPAPSAPVQAWRDYALTQGANPVEVSGLSKAQLQAVYGGRL